MPIPEVAPVLRPLVAAIDKKIPFLLSGVLLYLPWHSWESADIMRYSLWASTLVLASAAATTTSLSDICTSAYAKKALPVDQLQGVTVDPSSISTSLVTNFTASSIFYPTTTFDYCNVTFAYSHDGIEGDIVHVQYWLPAPAQFKNRYVSTGGGGWYINSGTQSIPTGVIVGGYVFTRINLVVWMSDWQIT